MTYNIIDDLTKLHIILPFLHVVKIPQQKENILKVLENEDKPAIGVEVAVISNQQQCSINFMMISKSMIKSLSNISYL
jgi:hypothetical protein